MQLSPARIIALIAVLAVIGAAGYIMTRPGAEKPVIGEGEQVAPQTKQYDNSQYGIHFEYPEQYVITEKDIGNSAEREHHSITLIRAEDAANVPENGEGPTAITIEIFGNGIDKQSAEQWIKNTSASNHKLAVEQTLASTSVSGKPAYRYTWDGLYRGDSVVMQNGTYIYMFSVTYMDTSAPIRDDFSLLLGSVAVR